MSDAIIVGENWISEHYFASDGKESFGARVRDQRKFWDAEEKQGSPTVRSSFTKARSNLVSLLAQLGDDATATADEMELHDLYRTLLDALGYTRPGLTTDATGPLHRINTVGLTGAAPLAILLARPVDDVTELLDRHQDTLLEPYVESEGEEPVTAAARLLSQLFTSDGAPSFALVLAGGLALVTDEKRWAEGRYLAVDLQLVLDRNDTKRGGELDRALCCISAEALAPDADGTIWWTQVLADSVTHTVGVSQDLRDGVRESIEIIAGEVVRRRKAQGAEPLPKGQAQPLAIQSLRFLYRILFLLYAEASPELGVLPAGEGVYERGYSLDRLRELALVTLDDPRSREGTHLYESLATLFHLVDKGHQPPEDSEPTTADGIAFQPLRADLFHPKATSYIDEVGLGNNALQGVLQRLLVSKKSTKADRGFISYAELGINQLGAVYEGLMSYTGFFAEDDLYEVAPGGDSTKGSWVVPVARSYGIAEEHFVRRADPITGEQKAVLHERGSFVFRLAGRERQQSASYYTPEVLTQFTVGQALEELLDQDGHRTTARQILDLTVCEPALGSGAFAIEAVRQLAAEYLRRREDELGEKVDPEQYQRELQKVKTYIALHNVYGVDLNATAVELAEISLWLDTMGRGLAAPWFGLHLRPGNSLIGARRATYRTDQVTDKTWLKATPRDVGLGQTVDGGIHHFLLPAAGWGSAVDAKEGKSLAPDAVKALKAWQRTIRSKPSKSQINRLSVLARRVERLWELALRRLTIAEQQIRRSIDVWGMSDLPVGGEVTREQIETSLADPAGAFQRLKTVMDAWNALWFWPLTDRLTTRQRIVDGVPTLERVSPPSLDEWLATVEALLGSHVEVSSTGRGRRWRGGDVTLVSGADWAELADAEELDLTFAGAQAPARILADHPWLEVTRSVADEQGFFHWELFFAPVFAARGGFDLQVGNPPWVRPDDDIDALLAEGDPWWQLVKKAPTATRNQMREATLGLPGMTDLVLDGTVDVIATRSFVSSARNYPTLEGLRPDLYRCFMEQTWRHSSDVGAISLIHPETHFTDEKARILRGETYRRLRRHWQFINELVLFEIHHLVSYGVHVYASGRSPRFLQATSLYHPGTVLRSFDHNGEGPEPGLKDEHGKWDLRPHRNRLMTVDHQMLSAWHALLENDLVPIDQTRMVYTVNRASAEVLEKIAKARRVGELEPRFSQGWNETTDFNKGRFVKQWGTVQSWRDAILQGPHLHVGNPFYRAPNETMLHNQDWTDVDLEQLAADALPITSYKPAGDRAVYDASYTDWGEDGARDPARNHYRVAWRSMAANTGERTLIPTLIPQGAAPLFTVRSIAFPGRRLTDLARVAGTVGSVISDFVVRAVPRAHILLPQIESLPNPGAIFEAAIVLRGLRLNCVTSAYADLWAQVWRELASSNTDESHPFIVDAWTGEPGYRQRPVLADVRPAWTMETPLRRDSDRRQALLEIDALVALSLGITADELVTIYRTQFPVLYGYDHGKYLYDANGRLVPTSLQPTWRTKGDAMTTEERTAVHPGSGVAYTYELPFRHLDREADLRQAMAVFSERLQVSQTADSVRV